ncbi:MAG: hypothetical protein CMH49_04245 [Myxococcales bacterium]|nr:hypothetical protein [Myxococcales bacterium]
MNAFLRDYTLPPEGAYADTHLLISRRAHDASNDELAVRRTMDLYWKKIRNNVTTTKKSTAIIGLRSTTGTSRIHFFRPYRTSRGPLCERVFSHYDPFFQGNITNTEENNMNLQRHTPRLRNARVSLLWEMAMQEGHQKQKFHASLALLICCRVNALWSGVKKKSMIPINPSDTRLHNYIRVLATICEGVYHSQFKASFPRYYRTVMKKDFIHSSMAYRTLWQSASSNTSDELSQCDINNNHMSKSGDLGQAMGQRPTMPQRSCLHGEHSGTGTDPPHSKPLKHTPQEQHGFFQPLSTSFRRSMMMIIIPPSDRSGKNTKLQSNYDNMPRNKSPRYRQEDTRPWVDMYKLCLILGLANSPTMWKP